MTNKKRVANCHPDRPYHAKNLCRSCYASSLMTEDKYKKAAINTRAWRSKNPEKAHKLDMEKQLKKKYGITLNEYERLSAEQNHVCALCNKPETIRLRSTFKINKLAVDHCHTTGVIRGLLCFRCNIAIGQIDKEQIAGKLVTYLKENK